MIYAVNKRTKEHRVSTPGEPYSLEWHFEEADPDGWIEWKGGECPLPEGQRHEVKTRDGEWGEGVIGKWVHGSNQKNFDIIAYRPILDSGTKPAECAECEGVRLTAFGDDCPACCKPEPSAWDGVGRPPVGCECEVRHLHSTDLEWRRIKITSITNDYVVGYIRDDRESAIRRGPLLEFRPIRSEEDRITEELERIMYKPAMTREMAARIYEAIRVGKVPGVKLTGGE